MTQETTKPTAADILAELQQFTGTEKYHNIGFGLLLTDGAKHFAEMAGAFWFFDIVKTEIMQAFKAGGDHFGVVRLNVTPEGSALISLDDGNGRIYHARSVPFTDCPQGEFKFYIQTTGSEKHPYCVMVPSEY